MLVGDQFEIRTFPQTDEEQRQELEDQEFNNAILNDRDDQNRKKLKIIKQQFDNAGVKLTFVKEAERSDLKNMNLLHAINDVGKVKISIQDDFENYEVDTVNYEEKAKKSIARAMDVRVEDVTVLRVQRGSVQIEFIINSMNVYNKIKDKIIETEAAIKEEVKRTFGKVLK